jgi:hypothetical protein
VKVGTKIEAAFGMIFEADSKLLVVVSGLYRSVHTSDYWHGF